MLIIAIPKCKIQQSWIVVYFVFIQQQLWLFDKTARSKAEPGHNGINNGDGLPFARLTRKFWGIFRPSEKILEKMEVGAAF